jgi:hypothetical protein
MARLVQIALGPFQFLYVARRAEQRHKMAAGRMAPDADMGGI